MVNNDRSALCLYTVAGCGVMSCVCGMAFLCGSTLVKVPLLQAGTVAIILPETFKSDVKPKQKNLNGESDEIVIIYFPTNEFPTKSNQLDS